MTEIVHVNPDWRTDELAEQVKSYIDSANTHATMASNYLRSALQDAWNAGKLLNALRPRFEHGEWLPWLDEQTIHRSTARRYMKLNEGHEYGDLVELDSLNAAMRALPSPRPVITPPPDDDPIPPKPETERVDPVAQQALVEQTRMAEERAAEAERRIQEQQQVITHYEQGAKVAEGYHAGRSVIEEGQQTARHLKGRIAELETKVKELTWECRRLRRVVRQLKAALPKKSGLVAPEITRVQDLPDDDAPPEDEDGSVD